MKRAIGIVVTSKTGQKSTTWVCRDVNHRIRVNLHHLKVVYISE